MENPKTKHNILMSGLCLIGEISISENFPVVFSGKTAEQLTSNNLLTAPIEASVTKDFWESGSARRFRQIIEDMSEKKFHEENNIASIQYHLTPIEITIRDEIEQGDPVEYYTKSFNVWRIK